MNYAGGNTLSNWGKQRRNRTDIKMGFRNAFRMIQ